jgi:hypothetical protein
MTPEGSLPWSQEPSPDPTLSQIDPSYFDKIHVNIVPHLRLGFPNGLFPSGFPTNILFSPIRATCPVHLILLDLVLKF